MISYRAAWVLPISGRPIAGGVVKVDRGLIVRLDADDADDLDGAAEAADADNGHRDVQDLGDVAVIPGLVNAHVHLELSWMRGQVPPDTSMPAWAARLMSLRQTMAHDPPEPIVKAIAEARASGTCLLGEVTNTLAGYGPLADSVLSAAIFREVMGFAAADPGAVLERVAAEIDALTPLAWLRPSIVPHAPYSVSPGLLQAIARRAHGRPISVHLGESAEEVAFLRDGSGAWRALLDSLGAWNAAWSPPGCGPVEYLDRLGLVGRNLLAVHGVQFTDGELARLAAAGATVVTCPRSNRWTGAGVPPVTRFYASGVRVALGTDSLASVEDLNLFAEMAAVRRLAPEVPACAILDSATRAGADALGFGAELGTLDPGKRAELLAVQIPPGVRDVEEYLLGGIEAADVRWLDPR